ncbi:Os02g0549650 [Oryza sativa Japonica Group]|uniref:Os02g0549650 protein n=1 Tax=Oryza sativa subsp. japonica TaxID=39947 RepID=A0A0P0VK84_ORYSJ|nr:hypothetical protein EE612_011658 [Oryza sativa]BAS79149.1 Os02g0549650 [Oryza sativa Japonica Group]
MMAGILQEHHPSHHQNHQAHHEVHHGSHPGLQTLVCPLRTEDLGRSPGGPEPNGRPGGLADFLSVAGTISDGKLR